MVREVIFGMQWGDEGKGKIVDFLVDQATNNLDLSLDERVLIMRYQGGANAGHTVVVDGVAYYLHQLPSGIISDNTVSLLGSGMYIDPKQLLFQEVADLETKGVSIDGKLFIDADAHITLEHYRAESQVQRHSGDTSTTGSGIKQTAVAKYGRVGIKFSEFVDKPVMMEVMHEILGGKLPENMKGNYHSLHHYIDSYSEVIERLKDMLVLESDLLKDPKFSHVIGEGAQGLMLDIDKGQYPDITSSHTVTFPYKHDKRIGVFKAYTSSVGLGGRAFMSHMYPSQQDLLRDGWHEKGVSTGRNRHIGWFDAVQGRYAIDRGEPDELALTCVDRLEHVKTIAERDTIKVCVEYEIDGKRFDVWQPEFQKRGVLNRVRPIFKKVPSWVETRKNGDLRVKPDAYVRTLEQELGMSFEYIGVGPGRSHLIVR